MDRRSARPGASAGPSKARRRPSGVSAVVVLALLVATGCGSTVPARSDGAAAGGAAPDGLSGDVSGSLADAPLGRPSGAVEGQASGARGVQARGGVPAGPSGSPAPGAAVAGTAASSGDAPGQRRSPASGRSTTAPVEVGLLYNKGADQAVAAIGATGISFGDQRKMLATVVEDLNRRGGLGGRRVKPVYVAQDSTDTNNFDNQQQAWCTTFTQDHHVAVVVTITGYGPTLATCLARSGVPLVARASISTSLLYETLGPYLYTLGAPPLDRGLTAAATALHARGFHKGAKLGLVYDDSPETRRAHQMLVAHLRRLGVDVAAEHAISQSSPDSESRDAGSAVLQFRSAGVTHVSFVQPGGGAYIFMNAAEAQQFRPRYGLSSFDTPTALTSVVPDDQLDGALVQGWQPLVDVAFADQPDANRPQRRCLRLHEAAGTTFSDGGAQGFAFAACEGVWLLEAALPRSGAPIDASAIQSGVEALAGSFRSTLTPQTRYGPGRHYGPAALRDISFDRGCGCFTFASDKLRPLP